MGMTPEDAWQEEAYDHMVEQILEDYRDEIIGEFVSDRMASYYRKHPDLSAPAEGNLKEAQDLLDINPTASLVFSRSAVEIALKEVLLKPVVFGMVHEETTANVIAELVLENRQFTKLLLSILRENGVDLTTARRKQSKVSLWEEMLELRNLRNRIVHEGEKATVEHAKTSLEIAEIIIEKIYPHLRNQIIGE